MPDGNRFKGAKASAKGAMKKAELPPMNERIASRYKNIANAFPYKPRKDIKYDPSKDEASKKLKEGFGYAEQDERFFANQKAKYKALDSQSFLTNDPLRGEPDLGGDRMVEAMYDLNKSRYPRASIPPDSKATPFSWAGDIVNNLNFHEREKFIENSGRSEILDLENRDMLEGAALRPFKNSGSLSQAVEYIRYFLKDRGLDENDAGNIRYVLGLLRAGKAKF